MTIYWRGGLLYKLVPFRISRTQWALWRIGIIWS
jgi:hypothetical protein